MQRDRQLDQEYKDSAIAALTSQYQSSKSPSRKSLLKTRIEQWNLLDLDEVDEALQAEEPTPEQHSLVKLYIQKFRPELLKEKN